MIKGLHGMFYSSEPEALRAFLREKLQLPFTDVGEGWLIFSVPEAELGCHPAGGPGEEGLPAGTHNLSFYCKNLDGTIAELKSRGVDFDGEIVQTGWGRLTHFAMPGGVKAMLYQPRYETNPMP